MPKHILKIVANLLIVFIFFSFGCLRKSSPRRKRRNIPDSYYAGVLNLLHGFSENNPTPAPPRNGEGRLPLPFQGRGQGG